MNQPLIRWVSDPPRITHSDHGGERQAFVEALKERPGVWGQYKPNYPHKRSAANGFQRDYPGTQGTCRTRGTTPESYDVYIRWVGIEDQP